MSLPEEFYTPEELAAILETPQAQRQRELLAKQGIPFAYSATGRPRVYRGRLLPAHQITQNADFDFSSLSGAGRQTEKTS